MFRTLARLLTDPDLTNPQATPSERLFLIHPLQLSRWLEQAWSFGGNVTWLNQPAKPVFLGDAGIVDALRMANDPDRLLGVDLRSGISPNSNTQPRSFNDPPALGETLVAGLPWEHAIYPLLIENTGVYEIMAEIVRRYAVGETLESPSLETQQWLRATEELFFRDAPLFHIMGATSRAMPDSTVQRFNMYWRLLGVDPAHIPPYLSAQTADPPWKRDVGTANERFHEIFVQFLQQVWLGIENVNNSSGANPTDAAYIAQLSERLRDGFLMRRGKGTLARQEFVAVATMSWFHLTVESDTPLVRDLKADGSDPADRLAKLGQRVGITPPRQAREYFDLAEPISTLLRFVELGAFDSPADAQVLFLPGTSVQQDMNNVIDLWQSATGDPIKNVVRPVAAAGVPAQPRTLPSSMPVAAAPLPPAAARSLVATNGSRPS